MMTKEDRIEDLAKLGQRLHDILTADRGSSEQVALREMLQKANVQNPWFDEAMSSKALHAFLPWLKSAALKDWLGKYSLQHLKPSKIGIIMAGNIPAVGFHDVLCVLASGHHAVLKFASDDSILIPWLLGLLKQINPYWENQISIFEGKIPDVDAIIATGSNNSSRYFEYYFRHIPSLIRKSRSSAAILTGNEGSAWLEKLGEDIFTYYGMGCRSVSKLFVPEGYDFNTFFEAVFPFSSVTSNRRYFNNYEYYRAYYMMNLEPLLDNHFMLLKRDEGFASPPSVLFFEGYRSTEEVNLKLQQNASQVQCVVGDKLISPGALAPGLSQHPSLEDYADGTDTMAFLCSLSS